ncbi:MAG: hypothetical protein BA862_09550 [Desulfobulbaceae bacterium S3730MH12]|nr:MAG: hypothetical protein BA862_09550 [Desulfobulbaceae bacterium S3730MH12]
MTKQGTFYDSIKIRKQSYFIKQLNKYYKTVNWRSIVFLSPQGALICCVGVIIEVRWLKFIVLCGKKTV